MARGVMTEAEGFQLLVEELERLEGERISDPYMCEIVDDMEQSGAIPSATADRMSLRIRRRLEECGLTTWSSPIDGELWDFTPHAQYGPRIIAAQWFALEAAAEGR